jgi:hypothetical protein
MKKTKKQQKYEYELPRDGKRLVIDAVTFGALHAIQDGINQLNVEERAQKAFSHFTNNATSNDLDMFQEVFIDAYTKAYSEKQNLFKKDISRYKIDIQQIRKIGGYENAFLDLRVQVARAMGGTL